MATLETRIRDVLTRIGTEFKSVRTSIGTLADLTTTAKGSVVSAINELDASIASAAGIDDTTATTSTTYSSSKVDSQIAASKAAILGTASSAWDTLGEIQALVQSDETTLGALTTAVGNRVRFDAAQSLTAPQKAQARSNIDAYGSVELGNPDTDFVAVFTAALV